MVTGTAAAGAAQPQQGVSNPAALSGMAAPAPGPGPMEPQKRVSSEHRRSNKPIMEKRRRARINNCLNELKTLILDAMKKDPARHSKLEKADILEMTVKHLETLQRAGAAANGGGGGDPPADRFRAGFRECAAELGRFPGIEPALRRRLLQHLDACVAPRPPPPRLLPTPPAEPEEAPSAIFIGGGVRLVPTRLANGDLALVLPAPPTLVPIPARTASSGSASSASSPSRCYSPVSSAAWSPSPPCSPPPPPPPQPAPLSLVTRRDDRSEPEERPWRPW